MIDIIIPIYNTKSTLNYVLTSIRNQKIDVKINVYLIDDNSSEDYQNILDSFKDLNIYYKKLNKNVGPGLARQKALDISKGKYVIFLDSDDVFYNDNTLSNLYNMIEKGYDYVAGFVYDEYRDETFVTDGDLHGKIYRKSFINKHNIKFNKTRFHEDNYFNNLFLLHSPKMETIDETIYVYINNKNSITADKSKEFERLEILLSNMNDLNKEVKRKHLNKQVLIFLAIGKIRYFNKLLEKFNNTEKKQFKEWLNKYNLNYEKYLGIKDYEYIYKELEKEL